MAKGPDWNDEHCTRPGAILDAMTEPNIPFDARDLDYFPPSELWYNGGDARAHKRFELLPFDKIVLDATPSYLVKGNGPRVGLCPS